MPSTFPTAAWDLAWLGYEVHCQAVGHAPRSIQGRRSTVLTLARCHPATDPEAITKADLIRHFARRREQLSAGGLSAEYNNLLAFFAWLTDDADLPVNPMAGIPRFKAPVPATPILTVDQVKAVLGACAGKDMLSLRDRAIVLLLFESGMRREELVKLEVGDVDLHTRTAKIRRGKGGRPRVVAFGPDTTDALRRYLRVRPGPW